MDYHPTGEVGHVTLLSAYNHYVRHLEGFLYLDYSFNTLRGYKSTRNSILRYLKNDDIYLSGLNYQFAEGYYTYLRTVEGLLPNSAFKNIKHLYRVIHVAIEQGWLTDNPFKNFHTRYKNPARPYLTEVEIGRLRAATFPTDRLTKVRDLFLFQVYTGLAYADMVTLTTNNIEVGVDGNKWIVINRVKTGTRSAIPLLPVALAIITKYRFKLPYYSNQKLNEYLKEVATVANITKHLTSHIGRHTFATTITLGKGVPIETVSLMLGHTSISTTQIYAKVTDYKVAKDMSLLL